MSCRVRDALTETHRHTHEKHQFTAWQLFGSCVSITFNRSKISTSQDTRPRLMCLILPFKVPLTSKRCVVLVSTH